MNFTTLQGLTIPEGVVTQITDASGRVLWVLNAGFDGEPIVLEVEKITSDTYAGEITYTGERFILLDIYPKTNGTVKVTYGGITKTIKDTSGAAFPNAQRVIFGTFNGVVYDTTTPDSGTLEITGEYKEFACGKFEKAKTSSDICPCITQVTSWGEVITIVENAFSMVLGSGCPFTEIIIPYNVTRIGTFAFYGCANMTRAIFENPTGWYYVNDDNPEDTFNVSLDYYLSDPARAVEALTSDRAMYTWYRS